MRADKIIITGTGRSGTTFLIQLFTHLGLDTGFNRDSCGNLTNGNSNAGLEITDLSRDILIHKSPTLWYRIPEIKKKYNLLHVIVPIRNLEKVAKSRERVKGGPGGFWDSKNTEEQMIHDTKIFYTLVEDLERVQAPYTLLHFPTFLNDKNLLFTKLQWMFDKYGVDYERFSTEFDLIADLNKVNFK